jgi:hypothetical protein
MKEIFLLSIIGTLLFGGDIVPFEQIKISPEKKAGELLLDTNYAYAEAPLSQSMSAIAFDGTNYFVVWTDARNNDIYGVRVNRLGEVLDSVGIEIGHGAFSQGNPSVAFDGTNYLVVWQDNHNGNWDIYSTRITQNGMVLDSSAIAISVNSYAQQNPSVTFGDSNYLVVWSDNRQGEYLVYGTLVSPSGEVLNPNGFRISNLNRGGSSPCVSFDGTNYLVVWTNDYYELYCARVTQTGLVLDPSGILISSGGMPMDPSVAFGGNNYLVTWADQLLFPSTDIFGALIDTTGNMLNTFVITSAGTDTLNNYSQVTFDGTNYFVVWSRKPPGLNRYDIYGARVDQGGTVIDPYGIPISTLPCWQYVPSLTFGQSNYFVVWYDARYYYSDIYGTPVETNGSVVNPEGFLISHAPYGQNFSSIDFDGMNYFAVWQDYRNQSVDIYGVRVNQSGTVLDPQGIPICDVDLNQISPCVAFDGTNYLVAWQDNRNGGPPSYAPWDIYGARVNQTGTIIDSGGFIITSEYHNQWGPAIAFDGTNYLVVYTDGGGTAGYGGEIYGIRINQDGVILDPPPGISICYLPSSNQLNPAVTFNGTNYLVVWQDDRYGYDFQYEIYGARVNPEGNVLDPDGICISPFVNYFNHISPVVSSDGNNYFVVWAYRDRYGGQDYEIYGCRLDSFGGIIDTSGIPICTGDNHQTNPSVIFDGTNYLVVWQDYRNGDYDIYGAKLNPSGVMIDSFIISNQYGYQTEPALARGNGDTLLITYSGFTPEINDHPANTIRIWGKFYPFVGIEEDARFKIQDPGLSLQIYPNPFCKKTDIRLQITTRPASQGKAGDNSTVSLKIYDATGRLVKRFSLPTVYSSVPAVVSWEGKDNYDGILPAGIYFCQVKYGRRTEIKKLILIR